MGLFKSELERYAEACGKLVNYDFPGMGEAMGHFRNAVVSQLGEEAGQKVIAAEIKGWKTQLPLTTRVNLFLQGK